MYYYATMKYKTFASLPVCLCYNLIINVPKLIKQCFTNFGWHRQHFAILDKMHLLRHAYLPSCWLTYWHLFNYVGLQFEHIREWLLLDCYNKCCLCGQYLYGEYHHT